MSSSVRAADWANLEGALDGAVVLPGSDLYDSERAIWNGDFDRRPDAIAKCRGVADVIAAVRFARATETPVAVRSGGHSYPGHSAIDGGMIIDLSQMKGLQIDPEARLARAQPGLLLGELDRETSQFGLALPSGQVSGTGMAGLALGGGFGRLTREFGLTCDQFLRLDVVTADGELVHASASENPDLFWALRGGGGNYGIVVNFEVRLHPVGEVQSGWWYYPWNRAEEVLRGIREFPAAAPRQMFNTIVIGTPARVALTKVDADPDDTLLGLYICHHGSAEEARDVLAPIAGLGVVGDSLKGKSYLEAQHELDFHNAYGRGWYMKSAHTRAVSDDLVEHLIKQGGSHDCETAGVSLTSVGGAITDMEEEETAYGGRAARWFLALEVAFTGHEDRDRLVKWAGETYDIVTPKFDLETSYVNFIKDTESSHLTKVFGEEKFQRLRAVKTAWDPDNFFAHNSNIPPL